MVYIGIYLEIVAFSKRSSFTIIIRSWGMELTILMPCLNEEKTIERCIQKAKAFLEVNQVDGEILVVDNGSSDNSIQYAEACGARVVKAECRGYGSVLIEGNKQAKGKYIIMADSDDSYNFEEILPFLEELRNGKEFVIGNRFKGGIEKGAMPLLHKYIGNPFLSYLGRKIYKCNIGDFHCGLRGYEKKAVESLDLKCTGMEYASEMVIRAVQNNLKISEVSVRLYKDGRNRKPHLRSFRDGARHLYILLTYR